MISVVVTLCLLIITGLIAILVLKRNDKSDDHAVLAGSSVPPGQSCPQSCPVVEEDYPWRRRGWGFRRPYPRPFVAYPYSYYPQSLISETCLNECCDYGRCIAGLGCNWKGITNKWHVGTPTQCHVYRNCINTSTKPENERHIECLGKAYN